MQDKLLFGGRGYPRSSQYFLGVLGSSRLCLKNYNFLRGPHDFNQFIDFMFVQISPIDKYQRHSRAINYKI